MLSWPIAPTKSSIVFDDRGDVNELECSLFGEEVEDQIQTEALLSSKFTHRILWLRVCRLIGTHEIAYKRFLSSSEVVEAETMSDRKEFMITVKPSSSTQNNVCGIVSVDTLDSSLCVSLASYEAIFILS